MVIVDEKHFMPYAVPPPPPYLANGALHPPPFPHYREVPTLAALPSHLLLKIVYMAFPQDSGPGGDRIELQRKTLYWLSVRLRLVNRAIYVGECCSFCLLSLRSWKRSCPNGHLGILELQNSHFILSDSHVIHYNREIEMHSDQIIH